MTTNTSWLLGCLLLTAPPAAYAQLGVRAGVGRAEMLSTKTPGQNVYTLSHLGYQLGVFYNLPLTRHVDLVPELAFSHEYFYLSTNQFGAGYYASSCDLRLSYLSLPVLTRASLGPAYLEAGPQLNFLLGGREIGRVYTDNLYGTVYYQDVDRATTDQYQRLDVGLVAGAGVHLRKAGLGLGARAYWGLRSLARTYAPGQGFEGELRNFTLLLNLSYRFKRAA